MVIGGWKKYVLRNVGTFKKGAGISRDESNSGNIPAVRYGEIYTTHDNYVKHYISYISEEVAAKSLPIQYGDLLFACSGETKEDIAKCVAIIDRGKVYAGGDIIVLTPGIECNPIFWGYALNAKDVVKQFSQKAQGDAIVHISTESIKSVEVIAPDYPEQCKIARVLSDIDEMIASLEKIIVKKKAIKQGTMQDLLTGKKRISGFTGEWHIFNLMQQSKVKARIGWQGLKKSEYLNSGYSILITGTDFLNGRVSWNTCHYVDKVRYDQDKNIQIQNNDILITKDGSLGKIALVQDLCGYATLNSGIFVVRPLKNCYDPQFVYYILSSSIFSKFLDQLSAGSTIVHLYQKDLDKFEFLIPDSIQEQQAIAEILSDMDAEIERLEEKLAKCLQTKQGMMQQLLTGKIRLI